MAKEKCSVCSSDIQTGFMDKIVGTQVTVKTGDKKKVHVVCPRCQKEKGDQLKGSLS